MNFTRFFSFILLLLWMDTKAQLAIQENQTKIINFDGSVSNVNQPFSGTGLATNPSNGQLDADAWSITGFSNGNQAFGQTVTSGDLARGSSTGGVTTGGLYAFETGSGNTALGVQPGGSDWTPGTITLKVINTGNSTISELAVDYVVYVLNNESRSNSFNFSYSTDGNNFQSVSNLDFVSNANADSNPSWQQSAKSTTINNLSLATNSVVYLRWSGGDVGGSGGRDEFAIDDISVTGSTGTITDPNPDPDPDPNPNTGYYADIGNEECGDLKTSLHNLINAHSMVSYGALWTHYQTTDDHPNDSGNEVIVWDIYSDNPNGSENEFTFVSEQCGTYSGEGDCYNREHTFPKSWWGGSTSAPMYTDLFTVLPVDGWINGIRSNNPYGEVLPGTETRITNNGTKLGSSAINIPNYTGSVFEPIDAYKGDLARGYFYLATCYEDDIANWENITAEADAVLDGTSFPVYEPWMIDMLLDWHLADPVSQKEIDRNEAIYAIQGNRNPFIDHPEYADLIWGSCGSTNPNPDPDPIGPVVLHEGYFESGWDGWIDGGSDCARYSGAYSSEGNYSIRIRDNSGTASSMTSPSFDLTAYNLVEIQFSFYVNSMEINEDFWLQYFNGSNWVTVESYIRGVNISNGQFYTENVTINSADYNFGSNSKFRFMCDASANYDQIYIDAVIISGTDGSSFRSDLEESVSQKTTNEVELEQIEKVLDQNIVNVYPNPAINWINIESKESTIKLVLVYNINGALIQEIPVNQKEVELNVQYWDNGIYIFQILDEHNNSTYKQIIRQ